MENSNNKKKNICFLIGSFQIGGAEDHVLQILKNLDYSKYNACVSTFSNDGGLGIKFEKLKIPIFIIDKHKNKVLKKLFKYFRIFSYVKFLKKNKINVIHIHLVGCYMFGIISSYLSCISNKIITWHNIYDNSVKKWGSLHQFYSNCKSIAKVKIGSYFASNIIAVSDNVKERNCIFYRINPKNVHTIHNGINVDGLFEKKSDSNSKLRKDNFSIIAVGTLQYQKGYIIMLKAMKEIIKRFPFVNLSIMGDGPDRSILESYIEQNNLKNNIYLKGIQKDIPLLLVKSDLFLMTSLWEGFSIALLEAMATGLPIIATEVGGNSEAIKHNKTGLLIPKNNIGETINAISQLIENSEKRIMLGIQARIKFYKQHTIEIMMKKLDFIYSK